MIVVAKSPFSLDDWEEIINDHEKVSRAESWARTLSSDWVEPDNPDLSPEQAARAGSEWFAFQKRFAQKLGRKFPKICRADLDRLAAQIELEFAKSKAIVGCADVATGKEVEGNNVAGNSGDETRPKTPGRRNGMTVSEANEKAKTLAKTMKKAFVTLSRREQAKKIGCSFATWKKTRFYQAAETKRPNQKPQKPRAPKAESLTSKREAVTGFGERDEVLKELALKELIAEQRADKEPSPLEDAPPDQRPKKVFFGKRV